MENFISFDTIGQYSAFNNNETLHPLVNIIDHQGQHGVHTDVTATHFTPFF